MDIQGKEKELTQKEIDRLVEQGGRFLRAIGTRAGIRRQIYALGYNQDQHDMGWNLYLNLCGYHTPQKPEAVGLPEDRTARDTIAEIDNWDEPHFLRAHAALNHYFPEQEAYIFNNLKAEKGITALASVKTFLDRVKTLREGTDTKRTVTRDADRQAVTLLEERRVISPESEQRLRTLISQVQKFMDVNAQNPVDEDADFHQTMQETATKFKHWLQDWRTTTRAGITRRDYLISLGLVTRRTGGNEVEEVDIEEEQQPGQPTTNPAVSTTKSKA